MVVEARNRFGGRIKTVHDLGGSFDMGPAWFWPGQPRMTALVARLGLHRFKQFAEGDQSLEDAQGRVDRGHGFAAMAGSWRIDGGMAALTHPLAHHLPERRKRLNTQVTHLARSDGHITATLADGHHIQADQVVLALPPRLADTLAFTPALPDAAQDALRAVPTWMAGQAKAVAVYDTPFWRRAGLSGDASSRRGPMVEVHDASPRDGGPYALFGFIGVPPEGRRDAGRLRAEITAQFGRLFGPQGAQPRALHIMDWAAERFTATPADLAPLFHHPRYSLPPVLSGLWEGALHFSGSETAAQFGGYLEGALEAAAHTFSALEQRTSGVAHEH